MSFTPTRPRRPAPASLWRNRDLRIVVLGRAASFLGDEAALVALVLRLHDSGAGSWAVAGLFAAGMLPLVVLAPVVGALVDRADSRALMLGSSLVQAALCAVLAVIAPAAPVPVLLVLVAVLGAAQAVASATYQALVPSIVGEDRLPAAMGLSQAAATAAGIGAPALGGLLTGLYGVRAPLLLDAVTFLGLAVAALLIRTRRGGAALVAARGMSEPTTAPAPSRAESADPGPAYEIGEPGPAYEDMGEPGPAYDGVGSTRGGFAFLATDRVVRPLVVSLVAFVLLGMMVNVVEVFLVRDVLRASPTWYGVLGALWGVGLLAGSVLGGRLRGVPALVRAEVLAALVLSAVMVGFASVPAVAWAVPVALVGGAANGVLNLTAGAVVMARAPEAIRGRVAAAMGGCANAASAVSLLLGGVLAGLLAPRTVFALAGAAGIAVTLASARPLLRAAHGSTERDVASTASTERPVVSV